MTSRRYRARFRRFRNFGLVCVVIFGAMVAAQTLLWTSGWPFWLMAAAAGLALYLGGTALLGYYVTGFSE